MLVNCAWADACGTGGKYFPPSVDTLLAWSTLFRSSGTLANYLSHVRTACLLVGAPVDVFEHPGLKRAKASVDKAGNFAKRPKMWLQHDTVLKLVQLGASQHEETMRCAMLFLFAYTFLLRLPSEALPVVVGSRVEGTVVAQAVVSVEGDELVLTLKRRKNKQRGSRITRKCWCAKCEETCPVHVLGRYFTELGCGARPFGNITASRALACLRLMLVRIGVADAEKYRTHDFRRGHAKDLQLSGAPAGSWSHCAPCVVVCGLSGASLYEILAAGEWRSPAFMDYLDWARLEADTVLQAHVDESDEEGE